jgi:LAO/AO transport system kinase
VNPGWGDEVQAGKAGLMEIGDVFVINKADRPGLEETRRDLSAQLARRPEADVPVEVLETVATEDRGVDGLARWVLESRNSFLADPEQARARRVTDALEVVCRQRLDARWRAVRDSGQFRQACDDVLAGRVSLAGAVDELLASAAE